MDKCYLCGIVADPYHPLEEHHLLNGIGIRKKADRYGLTVFLCPRCHRAVHAYPGRYRYLKRRAQQLVMCREGWDVDRFIKEFGKSYLEEI